MCASRRREPAKSFDQLARLGDLLVGQEPPGRIVERRAAQQRQAGVAVVEDLLHEVLELVAGERVDASAFISGFQCSLGELAEVQQLLVVEVVAHEMGLDVEDELAGEALRAGLRQLGLARLGRRRPGRRWRRRSRSWRRTPPPCRSSVRRNCRRSRPSRRGIGVGELVDARLDPLLGGALLAAADTRRWRRSASESALPPMPSRRLRRGAVRVH